MPKTPRSRDLCLTILRLARQYNGQLTDPELHALVARDRGALDGGTIARTSPEAMRFSAKVNLAKRRLVRDGLLAVTTRMGISLTSRGERFLAMGLSAVDARSQAELDTAALVEELRSIVDGAREKAASPETPSDADAPDVVAIRVDADDAPHFDEISDAFDVEITRSGDGWQLCVDAAEKQWIFTVREDDRLVRLHSRFLALPAEPVARAALLEAAMRVNAEIGLWHFAIGEDEALWVAAAIPRSRSDVAWFLGLIEAIESVETHCETLRRIADTPAALHALEAAFKRTP